MNEPRELSPAPSDTGLTAEVVAQALAISGVAVWHRALGADQVACNEQLFRILGLPFKPGGLSSARVVAMQHPEDKARAAALNEAVMAGAGLQESKLRYLLADGRCVHLLSRRAMLHDADGRPQAMLGVTLDVTERHEQEQRALENARRFELMARAANVGWWAIEGQPRRITFSEELRRMVGLGPQEAAPEPSTWIDRFVHPDDQGPLRERLNALRRQGATSVDDTFRLRAPDGRVLDIVSHSIFEPQGASPLRFGMLIDVTERRQAARHLAHARERAALAVSGAGIGTWEWLSRGNVALWDENMFRLRGLQPRTQALNPQERMALVHPDDREMVRQAMARAEGQRAPLAFEFRVVWPDGQVRWIASRSVDLQEQTGELRRIGANWDITDRRAAEQARRDAEGALRESQAKSRFLARMSHELRTPLHAVLGFAQLLLADSAGDEGGKGPSRRQSLQHIHRAGEHLLSLINDVLDLARVEGGEMALVRERVLLRELVRQTLPLVAHQAQAAGVHLATGALELEVVADATRLRQVLLNLLSNGIKYNRAGGEVVVDAAAAGALVHLRVRDNGRGIAPARLAELFQPFNRLGAERESIEGTGIGLAIVKSLVEHMGGQVQVSSEPGKGSLFEVVLPRASAGNGLAAGGAGPPRVASADVAVAADPAAMAAAPAAATVAATAVATGAAPPRMPHARRVLYIEDNAVNALIVRELLGTVPGYELSVACDGASGLALALQEQPELILLDMQLPDMDGFDVLRRLREAPLTAALPVVALSANVMSEQVSRGMAAGLTDYWTKPLDMPSFLRRLAHLLPPHPPDAS